MSRTCLAIGFLLAAMLTCTEAKSQNDDQPQITVVHPGVDALIQDLLSLTGLTSEEEQEQGEELQLFLEDISLGTDIALPIRVDIITGDGPLNYLVWIPYTDELDFLDNVESILLPVFEQPEQEDFYLLDDAADQGWLKLMADPQYAVLGLADLKTMDITKRQVLQAGDPSDAFGRLDQLGASISVRISNSQSAEDSLASRRGWFQETREEDMAALKKRPDESTSAFELRKGTASIIYDEIERIFVEAQAVNVWSSLDTAVPAMSLAFDATGLESTSLAESIDQFGQTPDAFANIQPLADSVLSGRLNHPIDSLRQQNAATYIDLVTAEIYSQLDASETLQDTEKEATRRIYDDVATVFRDGFASGNVNGFVEASHDGSEFTLVGAVSAPGSAQLAETLKQLPAAREGNTVTPDVATVDDITVHSFTLAEGFVDLMDELFGVGRDYYVGLGREQVWMATGPGSLELLKSKIAEAGEPATSDRVLTVDMKMSPWADRLHELAKAREQPEALEDRANWREDLLRLEQLSESLADEDQFSLSVTAVDSSVSGMAQLGKGLLTFVGVRIAKMSKENLDF